MFRILLPALLIGTPALAHDGLHHHPHGIEHGWIVAGAVAFAAGVVLAWRWHK